MPHASAALSGGRAVAENDLDRSLFTVVGCSVAIVILYALYLGPVRMWIRSVISLP